MYIHTFLIVDTSGKW